MDVNRLFELNVGEYFRELDYEVDVTRAVGDWGVDVFISKGGQKGAVQVKNYGNCRTRISRKDVMELYGAMAFFDCSFAKLVYNGKMNDDAKKVAEKLNIECIYKDQELTLFSNNKISTTIPYSFEECWKMFVQPLKGQQIRTKSNGTYTIRDVTNDRITYINTNGKEHKVKVDLFKWTFDKVLKCGIVHGKAIRDEFKTTHSSLVVAIFNLIPYFDIINGPCIIISSRARFDNLKK